MLLRFFYHLRAHRLPVSTREWLTFLEALQAHISANTDEGGVVSPDTFYYLARATLIKNETLYDRYDIAVSQFYEGLSAVPEASWNKALKQSIPADWLQPPHKLNGEDGLVHHWPRLSYEELMATLAKRLDEQTEAHHGGNKWIGTGGTSPFGHSGRNPEGVRIGGESANRSAVKVWQARTFRNLDDQVELGARNIKVALRRLRQFARSGANEELDLSGTIADTAKNAGYLAIKTQRERHNSVKVLLLMDVGGSMDEYVRLCEQMFSACKSEFKHLESFYFHNCVYESVWRDNRRRHEERLPLWDLVHKYSEDYRLIMVGDAAMSPYEITQPFGAVESANAEPGAIWLNRLLNHFSKAVWINPEPKQHWRHIASTRLIHELMRGRMFALSPAGLDGAIKCLQGQTINEERLPLWHSSSLSTSSHGASPASNTG